MRGGSPFPFRFFDIQISKNERQVNSNDKIAETNGLVLASEGIFRRINNPSQSVIKARQGSPW